LKTQADMPRPADPEFYLLTQNGTFLCRNHPFFSSDVRTDRPVRALAGHRASVVVNYPRLRRPALEAIVGFFGRVYQLHGSAAVVLLAWDVRAARYRLVVPEQEATVWQSGTTRAAQDVGYRVPALPPGLLLVGDIHSHANMRAFTSWADEADERHRDGVHA